MRKEDAKILAPIIQAYGEGKTIQFKCSRGWINVDEPSFNGGYTYYRIKPEPVYKPFDNHTIQKVLALGKIPYVRVKGNKKIAYFMDFISNSHITVFDNINTYHVHYDVLFNNYEFVDGTPCGVLVKE